MLVSDSLSLGLRDSHVLTRFIIISSLVQGFTEQLEVQRNEIRFLSHHSGSELRFAEWEVLRSVTSDHLLKCEQTTQHGGCEGGGQTETFSLRAAGRTGPTVRGDGAAGPVQQSEMVPPDVRLLPSLPPRVFLSPPPLPPRLL